MTCADLNNFLTGVREKSLFAGGGVGGGGGDAYYLFFLLCEINEFELSRSRGPYPLTISSLDPRM